MRLEGGNGSKALNTVLVNSKHIISMGFCYSCHICYFTHTEVILFNEKGKYFLKKRTTSMCYDKDES